MSDSSERKRAGNIRKYVESGQASVAIIVDESGESFVCPIGRQSGGVYNERVQSTLPDRTEQFWSEDRGRINLRGMTVQKRVCPRGGYVGCNYGQKCAGCRFMVGSFRICYHAPLEGAKSDSFIHTYVVRRGDGSEEMCRIGDTYYTTAQAAELEAAKAEFAARFEEVKLLEVVEVHEGETHLTHKGMFIKV